MNKYLLLTIVIPWWNVFSQQDSKNQVFYDRLAAAPFVVTADVLQLQLAENTKREFAQQGAILALFYWVHTREGGVSPSKTVEAAIGMFYERTKKMNLDEVFLDPLNRKKMADPELIGISGFKKITTKEYEGYVEKFKGFLEQLFKDRNSKIKNP